MRGIPKRRSRQRAAKREAKAAAAAPREPVAPGALLSEGVFGSYVTKAGAQDPSKEIRDGYGRSCIKDGLWTPGTANEQCHPELFNEWRTAHPAAEPSSDLAKRIEMPPPEVDRAARAATPVTIDPNGPQQPDAGPGIAPPPEKVVSTPSIIDNTLPTFPVTTYAAEPSAESSLLASDDDDDDEGDDDDEVSSNDTPDDDSPAAETGDGPAMLAEDDAMPEPAPVAEADDDEEDDSVAALDADEDGGDDPEAVAGGEVIRDDENLALADESDDTEASSLMDDEHAPLLVDDDAADAAPVAAADADEAEEPVAAADETEDVETAFLGDVEEPAPPVAALDPNGPAQPDPGPGVAPAPERITPSTSVVDNSLPAFPITRYTAEPAEDEAPVAAMMDDDDTEDDQVASVEEDEDEPVFPADQPAEVLAQEEVPATAMTDDDDAEDDQVAAAEEDEDEPLFPADQPADVLAQEETGVTDSAETSSLVGEADDEEPADTEEESDYTDIPTPEEMLSEQDRSVPETPAVVAAAEPAPAPVAPAPAPAPAQSEPAAEFPVTKYEYTPDRIAQAEEPKPAQPQATAPRAAPEVECPPVTIQMEPGRFDFDKWQLRPELTAQLDAVAEKLKSAKCEAITITGHTDRIGSKKYNQKLSERRAEAAKKYLVEKHGIDGNLISTAGKGKTAPLTQAADCKGKRKKALIACLAPDRRIEVTVRVAGQSTNK
ncbi:MAG: OmpA family protein [Betaproteobacteria bacterium]|nr:OmpA family protein [Betaproteobacteria bacterium]